MILCCGEALIDMIPSPTASGRDGFVPHSGGSVFNTAIALGRLGARVGMVTGVSSDMFGQQLLADLTASQVDTSLVVQTSRPTTLAFVSLQDGQARYAFFDEGSAGRMLSPGDMPALPSAVTGLFFGGISLAVEPAALAYADLAARPRGERVMMLDPNIRPGFIRDEAAYRARLSGLIALADIVKLSDEDLDWLFPGAGAIPDRVRMVLTMGPSLVIITKGRQGAEAWTTGHVHAAAPGISVNVADTVGAGDTFNAGVLASLSKAGVLTRQGLRTLSHPNLTHALSLGTAAAAITVSRSGANPPWASELPG